MLELSKDYKGFGGRKVKSLECGEEKEFTKGLYWGFLLQRLSIENYKDYKKESRGSDRWGS